MTSGQQDRPEDESEDSQQQSGEGEQSQGDEGQQTNYVPGSAADPTMGQGSPEVGVGAYYGQVSSPEERNWSMLLHLSALAGLVTSGIGSLLGPLIVWLIFRARSDMVDYHGKRALNFQISFFIYGLVAALSIIVLIGFLLLPVVIIVWLIWTILAAIRASRGDPPGYILSIRFLK